jgi:hypothetical protein
MGRIVHVLEPEEVVHQVKTVESERFGLSGPGQHIGPAHPLAEHNIEAGRFWIDHVGDLRDAVDERPEGAILAPITPEDKRPGDSPG